MASAPIRLYSLGQKCTILGGSGNAVLKTAAVMAPQIQPKRFKSGGTKHDHTSNCHEILSSTRELQT